ncbi:hypothetical protein R1flu_012476 [Riccia fluitans]|uniref:tRNA-intron lyase n=1 Tax=Riccia fluitans TaxID=41844 RepID=A0ABD1ZBW2_9MARC
MLQFSRTEDIYSNLVSSDEAPCSPPFAPISSNFHNFCAGLSSGESLLLPYLRKEIPAVLVTALRSPVIFLLSCSPRQPDPSVCPVQVYPCTLVPICMKNGCGCSSGGVGKSWQVAESLPEMDFQRSLAGTAQVEDLPRMQKLLDKGANVNGDDTNSGYSPLHYSARQGHVKACRLLLQHGASVDWRTSAGKATSLHRAAYAGNLEVVKLLLQYGADPTAQDSDGHTPISKARMQGHEDIVKLLTPSSDHAEEKKSLWRTCRENLRVNQPLKKYGRFKRSKNSSVLLLTNWEQAQLLNRACIGRPYPPATAPPPPSAPAYPPPIPGFDDPDAKDGLQLFQLALEEGFFLSHEMKCIKIYQQTSKGEKVFLNDVVLWRRMLKKRLHFAHYYKAYSHLRSRRWVVTSGIQFGADFMAYRHHPGLVHSDYAVLVMSGEEKASRVSTWTEMHAMGRLCGSVAKTLLLMYVKRKDAAVDLTFPSCLEDFDVETVEAFVSFEIIAGVEEDSLFHGKPSLAF